MIELVTGLPGNGKTLFTIGHVKAWAERESRPVFYHGIPELKLDWQQLEDPAKWMEVPPKSIVVIDEAQRIFRNRSLGASPPKHVTELETHRHLGIDLVFITQHPSLLDPAIRRLAGRHQHMVRIWGAPASTIHKWDAVRDNCEKPAGRKDSESRKWVFDKSLYSLYKSAEVHTGKTSIPTRVKLLAVLPIVLGLAVWGAYTALHKVTPGADAHKSGASATAGPGASSPFGVPVAAGAGKSGAADPVQDLKEYVWKETPRVAGLPQTAPKYDNLTTPTRVPIPAMCVQRGSVADRNQVSCKCWSQQATPMDVPFNMCLEFARNGFFRDFDADKDSKDSSRSETSQRALDRVADAPVPDHSEVAGTRVLIPGQSMGPQRTDKSPPMTEAFGDGPPNNRATRAAAGAARAAGDQVAAM